MKKIALLLCLVLATGAVLAGTTTTTPPAASSTTGMSHHMTVQVVSFDAAAKTLTVKDSKGETHTAPVMGEALKHLDKLKAGETIKVTCKDSSKGEHLGITHISIPKEHKSTKPAAPATAPQ